MSIKYTFWLKAVVTLQFVTGFFHVLSFVNKAQAANDTEQQLLDLMSNYKFDLGAGFHHSMNDLMNSFSISFALLLFFSGAINLFLLRNKINSPTIQGVIIINFITYLICFITMLLLTFLPPIICTGLIVLALLLAYLTVKKESSHQ